LADSLICPLPASPRSRTADRLALTPSSGGPKSCVSRRPGWPMGSGTESYAASSLPVGQRSSYGGASERSAHHSTVSRPTEGYVRV